MNNFLNSIKITQEEKKEAFSKIIFTVMHSSNILSLNEVLQNLKEIEEYLGKNNVEHIKGKLNQNEILASYSLAREIKISTMISPNHNKKLMEYLELGLASINEDNLLKFINETVKDIELTKKRNPNAEWSLQVGKIFSRLEGKNPYEEESLKQESKNSKEDNIIKLSDYMEK